MPSLVAPHGELMTFNGQELPGREYIIGDFCAADIMLGHACYMSRRLGCVSAEHGKLNAYIDRVEQRPAFQTGINA